MSNAQLKQEAWYLVQEAMRNKNYNHTTIDEVPIHIIKHYMDKALNVQPNIKLVCTVTFDLLDNKAQERAFVIAVKEYPEITPISFYEYAGSRKGLDFFTSVYSKELVKMLQID